MEYRLKKKCKFVLKFKLWQSVTRLFWLLPEVLEIYFICFVCDFVFPILVQYSTSCMQVAWEGSCHHCTATPPVRPPLFEALRKCYITSCRKYRIKTGKCSNFEAQLDIFCDLKRIFKNDCSSWTKWMTLTSLYFIHSWDELWDL